MYTYYLYIATTLCVLVNFVLFCNVNIYWLLLLFYFIHCHIKFVTLYCNEIKCLECDAVLFIDMPAY